MKQQKKIGQYYTPISLSNYIVGHIYNHFKEDACISILEPSVGDGVFIKSLLSSFNESGKSISFTLIERELEELKKVKDISNNYKNNYVFKFINDDFLIAQAALTSEFDLIIGNPPYISNKFLTSAQIELCQTIHDSFITSNFSIKNIWTSFLIRSANLLTDNGVLAFVLPSELLQVKYTEDIRNYIFKIFEMVEIINFKQLIFDNAGQDTIVLMCYKKSTKKGIFISTVDNIASLSGDVNFVSHPPEVRLSLKDVHHDLSNDELEFLHRLKENLKPFGYYAISKPGVVTAANDYFIVNREVCDRYHLNEFAQPILQKSNLLQNTVDFTLQDFNLLLFQNKPSLFLNFSDDSIENFSPEIQDYLKIGVDRKLNLRYKCKSRKKWYKNPNVSQPWEGFFFKRSHNYSKIIKNSAQILVTDNAYMIKPKAGKDINSLIYSFYNSLTLAFCELNGRFYGGGVLELTPSEFKSLPLPYLSISNNTFDTFSIGFHNNFFVEDFLRLQDQRILGGFLRLSNEEINLIQVVRQRLVSRRINR